ncbi:MAG: SAM-dependent methyltransferase [Rubrivivax sp.]|nr:SAM-dependent methyltransferase [Rubrivivax sp.]
MSALSDHTFEGIRQLMHGIVGLSFADAKKPLVASRLAPRIARLGLERYEDYLALIERDGAGGELQVAIDLLTTNETYFFREPRHFELLERELGDQRPAQVRVWSAASSYGDEAYSVAMLLADLEQAGRLGPDWRITATDVSDRVLKSAVEGVYPADRLREVTPARLKRYCLRGDGDAEGLVMVQPTLRRRVQFGYLNLTQAFGDWGPFDAVFLRNVLIYFDAATKAAVAQRVLGALRPGGLFFIGTAEGRIAGVQGLTAIAPGAFRKTG